MNKPETAAGPASCPSRCSQSGVHDWVATADGEYAIVCLACGETETIEERKIDPDYVPSEMW